MKAVPSLAKPIDGALQHQSALFGEDASDTLRNVSSVLSLLNDYHCRKPVNETDGPIADGLIIVTRVMIEALDACAEQIEGGANGN